MAAESHLTAVYDAVFVGDSDLTLTRGDSLQAETFMYANLRNVENVWMQSREGVVGEDVLNSYAFQSERDPLIVL